MSTKHFGFSLLATLVILIVFEFTSLDMDLQKLLFDTDNGQWFWSADEPVKRFVFYTGAKGIIILFGLCLMVLYCLGSMLKTSAHRQSRLRIVLLSMILVPTTVALIKNHTNIAYPRNLDPFDGPYVYKKVFQVYPHDKKPPTPQRGFPAGHASAGYSLLSLYYLFETRRHKFLALGTAFFMGSAMGIYKILIGDHFLSHTIISLGIAWSLVNLIAWQEAMLLGWINRLKQTLFPHHGSTAGKGTCQSALTPKTKLHLSGDA